VGAEESSDDEVESVRSVLTEFRGMELIGVKNSAEGEKQTSVTTPPSSVTGLSHEK
jgi:hypothetical protein